MSNQPAVIWSIDAIRQYMSDAGASVSRQGFYNSHKPVLEELGFLRTQGRNWGINRERLDEWVAYVKAAQKMVRQRMLPSAYMYNATHFERHRQGQPLLDPALLGKP